MQNIIDIQCRPISQFLKGALHRIWCDVHRLGDSGVEVV